MWLLAQVPAGERSVAKFATEERAVVGVKSGDARSSLGRKAVQDDAEPGLVSLLDRQ